MAVESYFYEHALNFYQFVEYFNKTLNYYFGIIAYILALLFIKDIIPMFTGLLLLLFLLVINCNINFKKCRDYCKCDSNIEEEEEKEKEKENLCYFVVKIILYVFIKPLLIFLGPNGCCKDLIVKKMKKRDSSKNMYEEFIKFETKLWKKCKF